MPFKLKAAAATAFPGPATVSKIGRSTKPASSGDLTLWINEAAIAGWQTVRALIRSMFPIRWDGSCGWFETETDGPARGVDVMEIARPGALGDIASLDPSRGPLGPGLKVEAAPFWPSSISSCLLLLWRPWAFGQRASVVQAQRHVHSPLAERAAPDHHRRPVVQRLMRARVVVKADPSGNSQSPDREATKRIGPSRHEQRGSCA